MILFVRITTKISQIVTLFSHNGKLPEFFYKLPHYNFSDVLSKFIFALRISKKCIGFFLSASFGIEVLIETIVSEF